jgi:SAM-dependent methyltransferase
VRVETTPRLMSEDGDVLHLPWDRFLSDATDEDHETLDLAVAPVIDIGCGPGRHVLALARKGVMTLGLDVAAAAVAIANRRGAPVLHRSVFQRIPGKGRWATALLLDGNIGIGGDPIALLRRVRLLLRRNGRVLTEVEGPGAESRSMRAQLVAGTERSSWFDWAMVSADDLDAISGRAGFAVRDMWVRSGRWFARLEIGS